MTEGCEEIATACSKPRNDAHNTIILNTHYVILNTHYVILNVVKNLSDSTDVLLLCYPVDASLSLSMTKHSEEMLRLRSA